MTPELRVFRELWRHNYAESVAGSIALLMYREINKRLAEGATREEIKSYLDSHTENVDGRWSNGMVAYDLHYAYHHETPPLWPEPMRVRPHRLHRMLWGQAGSER